MGTSVSEAMEACFERFRTAWRARFHDEPWAPHEPEVEPGFYVGPALAAREASYWVPKKQVDPSFAQKIEARFGVPLHRDIFEYLSAYWFAELRGRTGELRIQMKPVLPGLSRLEDWIELYRRDYGGQRYVALGSEARTNGFVIVDNTSGEVFLDDWGLGKIERIAPSLGELLSRLEN